MIDSLEGLLALYPPVRPRSLAKQLARLEAHSRRFIGLSPFLVIATHAASGEPDASPRGGEPGFVLVADDQHLLIPDAAGNNRLDSLRNILATGRIGLLFFVPGVDETLRVNGRARLRDEAEYLARFAGMKQAPRLVIEVEVEEVYLHCARALMRSRLWDPEARIARDTLPSMAEMIKDQVGDTQPAETQAEMLARYRQSL